MSCPKCRSDDWKMASVIHAGGLNGISTSTGGFGVGTGGLGVGVADTNGTSQTLLSKLAAPPKQPISNWLSLSSLGSFILIFCIFFGVQSESDAAQAQYEIGAKWGVFLSLLGVVMGWSNQRLLDKKFKLQQLEYSKKKMCLRCGTFFVDRDNSSCSFNDDGTITFKAVQNNEQKKSSFQNDVVEEVKSTEELKQEIIRLREKGFTYYDISCEYNDDKVPLPKEYANQKKWSPSLVKQVEEPLNSGWGM
jgi:hypothetical protein